MSKAPERIYLQVHPDEMPGPDFDDERTWCQDPINQTDIEYVRADLYEQEHRNWMGMLWQRNWAMDQLEQLGHDELPPPMPDDYLSWSTE